MITIILSSIEPSAGTKISQFSTHSSSYYGHRSNYIYHIMLLSLEVLAYVDLVISLCFFALAFAMLEIVLPFSFILSSINMYINTIITWLSQCFCHVRQGIKVLFEKFCLLKCRQAQRLLQNCEDDQTLGYHYVILNPLSRTSVFSLSKQNP